MAKSKNREGRGKLGAAEPSRPVSAEKLTILNAAAAPAHFSLVEKKSEFIGDAAHCADEEQAMAFVASIRELHPKARHVAFAAIFESKNGSVGERMSDDGEPSGTAGKPILDALAKSSMSGCVVTVTRYFGGILLGSAGLIRAYSTAASGALGQAQRARVVEHTRVNVTVDYPRLATLDHLVSQFGARVEQRDFTEVVHSEVLVESGVMEQFRIGVREAFQAEVSVEEAETVPIAVPLE